MKRKDWKCPMCSAMMMMTSSGRYLTCPTGHLKLQPRHAVGDLPLARRHDYRRFTIDDEGGYWEYVPHTHHGCMGRAPEPDTVVAKVLFLLTSVPHYRAMVFRSAKPPRGSRVAA